LFVFGVQKRNASCFGDASSRTEYVLNNSVQKFSSTASVALSAYIKVTVRRCLTAVTDEKSV
jgi:hypothetical protein